jgi:prolipoprotein diacylglyceryltransferase
LPNQTFDGQLFLIGTAVYSAGRLLTDAYRANAWLTNSGYHIIQILSLLILLTTLILLARNQSTAPPINN